MIELMLWIIYCEEAINNYDNYGRAITFDLTISEEKKETIAEKERRQRVQRSL